jgi:hypothetical protein
VKGSNRKGKEDRLMAEKQGKIRVVTLKHTQFIEMGKDLFDQRVTEFLEKVGEQNIIATHAISYQHVDMVTRETVIDYGLVVIYREP